MTIVTRRAVLLLLAVSGIAATASAEYRTIENAGLRITIDTDWATRNAPGYLPIRLEISNTADARTIEIVVQASRSFRLRTRGIETGRTTSRQSLRLGKGDRVQLTLPVPVLGDGENLWAELREDGRVLERFNYFSVQGRTLAADASVLTVADPSSDVGQAAGKWGRAWSATPMRGGGGFVAPSGAPSHDFVLHPSRLPTNWIGYTSLRAVLIGPVEWAALSDAQRTALLTWTAAGGDLFLIDGDAGSAVGVASAAAPPVPGPRAHFFGRIHTPTLAHVTSTGLAAVLKDTESSRDPNWALPANSAFDWGTVTPRGFRLAIPGIDGVPARTYLAILVLFAIFIGPVNYWWLKRKRMPVMTVLTVPLISATFIALLGGYAIAGEGFGVYGRATTFTVLDQASRQASTRGSASLYAAGLLPASGLRFPRDVAVFPIGPDGLGARGQFTLDLSEAQLFSGVMPARAATNLEVISVRPARERLTFTAAANGLEVVNGLDARITALFYKTADGVYKLTSALAPGSKAMLIAGGPSGSVVAPDIPLSGRLTHLMFNQPVGSYLALLDRSPFFEPGVAALMERGSVHVVLGYPDGRQ